MRLPQSKRYGIRDFVLSGTHEHYVTEDTVMLKHSGDIARFGVGQNAEVASIKIQVFWTMDLHYRGPGALGVTISQQTSTFTQTKRIDSGSDYTVDCKEHYNTSEIMLPNGEKQTGLNLDVGNVDIRITLLEVLLVGGGQGAIGQGETAGGSPVAWADILNGVGWVLGGLAVVLSIYVLYRVYRKYRHGEALFPRLDALRAKMGGGE